MSVNLELPTGEGLQKLAPQKTQKAILKPMRQIQSGIVDYRLTAGKSAFLERSSGNRYLSHSIFDTRKQISASAADLGWSSRLTLMRSIWAGSLPPPRGHCRKRNALLPSFLPARARR